MADQEPNSARRVTVVGGGFTGAIFAHHLLRMSRHPVAIDIVEERSRLGAGLAYSAVAAHQTTNIPVSRMSVYPDDRGHFERWLTGHGGGPDAVEPYPNRALFGAYMDELVRASVPLHPQSRLRHLRTRVTALARHRDGLAVHTADGRAHDTDVAVLATGNPTPIPPAFLTQLTEGTRVIHDPWHPGALAGIRPDDRLLILGVGLTMGEVVAGLKAGGHRGAITAISRRGRRPERSMVAAADPFGDFETPLCGSALALLRHFRGAVREAETAGLSWRSVAASARAKGWEIWQRLPDCERRRFARHLRPYWEALRHVMAGPIYDLLAEDERRGRLRVMAASVRHIAAVPEGLDVTLHRRGTPVTEDRRERFDALVNCTGAAYATLTDADPFWSALTRAGLVTTDTVGLGIAVDREGRALTRTGTPQPDLLVLGTLARGTFGELTGVPELSRYALEAAQALTDAWSRAAARLEPTAVCEENPILGSETGTDFERSPAQA